MGRSQKQPVPLRERDRETHVTQTFLHNAVVIHQQIGGLEVSVDDLALMQVVLQQRHSTTQRVRLLKMRRDGEMPGLH